MVSSGSFACAEAQVEWKCTEKSIALGQAGEDARQDPVMVDRIDAALFSRTQLPSLFWNLHKQMKKKITCQEEEQEKAGPILRLSLRKLGERS